MGLLHNILSGLTRRRRATENPPIGEWRRPWVWRTHSSEIVDEDRALSYAAVWACVRIISETLAAMPWPVMEKKSDGSRERLDDHAVHGLLNERANLDTTSFDFKQSLIAHVLTWGNGYAEIDRSANGTISNLWQLAPDRVRPTRNDAGQLVYEVMEASGETTVLPGRKVLHLRGLGFDGIQGYSVIRMAAQSIGLGIATERFGSDFFGNGAHPSMIVTHPGTLNEATINRMRDSVKAAAGAGNWLNPMIFEEGVTATQMGIPPEEAQFLETRKFQITEIARWFRVPPHKLADLERATFSNIEQQAIEFVTDTIMPWAVRFEQEVNSKLLPRSPGVFTKINLNGLLRGDIKSRYDAYAVGRNWGWLSANDVRRLEDLNPIDGGDDYMAPLNMTLLDKVGEDPPVPPAASAPDETPDDVTDQDEPASPKRNGTANRLRNLLWKD